MGCARLLTKSSVTAPPYIAMDIPSMAVAAAYVRCCYEVAGLEGRHNLTDMTRTLQVGREEPEICRQIIPE